MLPNSSGSLRRKKRRNKAPKLEERTKPMTELFMKFIDAGASSVAVMLCVIILRTVFTKTKRIPHWVNCFLWAVVGLKLLIPFSPKAAFGLLSVPAAKTTANANTVVPAVSETVKAAAQKPIDPNVIFAGIWIAGSVILLLYCVISTLKLRYKLSTAVLCENIKAPVPVKLSEHAKPPFVFGIFRPKIYAPFDLDNTTVKAVVAHETAHLQRHDNLWKLVGFVILALHWYDPLVWLCFYLYCRDTELACDEKVYRDFSEEERCCYAEALIKCSVPRKFISVCPVSIEPALGHSFVNGVCTRCNEEE